MSTARRWVSWIGALLWLAGAGCGVTEPEKVATAKQELALPNTGFIPQPVRVSDLTGLMMPGPDGLPIPTWNGSVVDLMAADAWAECNQNSFRTAADDSQEADAYLRSLIQLINTATAPLCYGPALTAPHRWRNHRTNPQCNADASTNKQRALTFANIDRPFNSWPIPTINDMPSNTFNDLAGANENARKEMDVAIVNLCMAQRLREYQSTADSLVASSQEQRELLNVIRERVQIAMLQYALIGMALYNPDQSLPSLINPYQFLPAFAWWRSRVPGGDLAALGADFAAAIKLHIDVTRELGEALVRTAAARSEPDAIAKTKADQDWGKLSPRRRLLALLYGGDPMAPGGSFAEHPWLEQPDDFIVSGVAHAFAPADYAARGYGRYVSQDASAPEVTTLLGLVRKADALYFTRSATPPTDADNTTSSGRMYRAVEALLRTQDCLALNPSSMTCTVLPATITAPTNTNYEQYTLWKRFRVRPDHATALTRLITQAMPFSFNGTTDLKGAMQFTGVLEQRRPPEIATGTWFYLPTTTRTTPWRPPTLATPFVSSYHLPKLLAKARPPRMQGFVARVDEQQVPDQDNPFGTSPLLGSGNNSMRHLGAAAALATVQDAIFSAITSDTSATAATVYYELPLATLSAIRTAVGSRQVLVRPKLTTVTDTCNDWQYPVIETGLCSTYIPETLPDGRIRIILDVLTPASDPMVEAVVGTTRGLEVTATLDPTFRSSTGASRADFTTAAWTTKPLSRATSPALGIERRTAEFEVLPGMNQFTIMLATGTGASRQYEVVVDGWSLETIYDGNSLPRTLDARQIAPGGTFGLLASQAFTTLQQDWSIPAFDGFGLPINWIPPRNVQLNATASNSSVTEYVAGARQAADEATAAVRYALDNLLKEETDTAALNASRERAATIDALEQRALCGDWGGMCDTGLVDAQITGTGALFTLPNCGTGGPAQICNLLKTGLTPIMPATVRLHQQVYAARTLTNTPEFTEFGGGEMQAKLVREWLALKGLIATANDAVAFMRTKESALNAAQVSLTLANATSGYLCGPALQLAVDAGLAFDTVEGLLTLSPGDWTWPYDDEPAWSPGPLNAAVSICEQSKINLPNNVQELVVTLVEGIQGVSTQLSMVQRAVGELQSAIAETNNVVTQARLAKERAAVEAKLESEQLPTRFGTARRYHNYDIWRARALLENARRYSVAARRAIEAHYVVDFSEMRSPEAFVAAPAEWADQIYEYDLSAPAAVGLQKPPQESSGIYPNRISDYVSNLEAFMRGYAVNRPTAVESADAELISLPGPDLRVTINSQSVLSAASTGWYFFCPNTSTWITHPASGQTPATAVLDTACSGQRPTLARIDFRLDPWARLDGDIANPSLKARHNVRWLRMALNLVGTGIQDCTRATDPIDCYSNPFTRYSLKHVGPAWVTNYDQQWRALGVAQGFVESGKALVAEEWLDPVANGWTAPLVQQVARTELVDRPVGGEYEVQLDVPKEMRLDRLERVQVLLEDTYWVKEQ